MEDCMNESRESYSLRLRGDVLDSTLLCTKDHPGLGDAVACLYYEPMLVEDWLRAIHEFR